MRFNRRRLFILSAAIIVVVLLIQLFRLLNTSTIQISFNADINVVDTVVLVDGERAVLKQESGIIYEKIVTPGTYEISVISPGSKTVNETITTSMQQTSRLEVTIEAKDSTETAMEIYEYPDSTVVNPKYFGNKDWIVFSVALPNGDEGARVISRFDSYSKEWIIIAEGSDFDVNDGLFTDAPDELVTYVGRK